MKLKPKHRIILTVLCAPAAIFAIGESDNLTAFIGIKLAAAVLFYTAYRLAAYWEAKGEMKLED